MTRRYELTAPRRLVNSLVTLLLRAGIPVGTTYLLTVPGRTTGVPRTTPVTIEYHGDHRWLVAPYGAVNWVRNARAAGWVTLRRGGYQERLQVREVGVDEAALVLKQYVEKLRVVRPFFEARPYDDVSAFAAEAYRHPVFRIAETGNEFS